MIKRRNIITEQDRRNFMKGVGALGLASLFPISLEAAAFDYDDIKFDYSLYENNNAQTIIVFLYGGPSELGGNMTNIEEISDKSQNPYPLDDARYIKLTKDKFWGNAGGYAIQNMLDNKDINIFRTCYRTDDDTKSHEECISQSQRGKETAGGAGILANLAGILYNKGAIEKPSKSDDIGKSIPFVTMEGESTFFTENTLNLPAFMKAVAFDSDSTNPYERNGWLDKRILNKDNNLTISDRFDRISRRYNASRKIKEAFDRRVLLRDFVDRINSIELPESIEYPTNNIFADGLKRAMTILINNPYTKVVSMGSPGLGGWDDHSNAISVYSNRMTQLMEAIEVAVEHMKAEDRKNINIVVFGEFGRNVNYNNSLGWDHGSNQVVYWLGGKDYMQDLGIVGETEVDGDSATRLYMRPKNYGKTGESYNFQVFSVAATLYKMYGITNPEVLTNGNGTIRDLLRR